MPKYLNIWNSQIGSKAVPKRFHIGCKLVPHWLQIGSKLVQNWFKMPKPVIFLSKFGKKLTCPGRFFSNHFYSSFHSKFPKPFIFLHISAMTCTDPPCQGNPWSPRPYLNDDFPKSSEYFPKKGFGNDSGKKYGFP
jgi:hypothetical protein